MFRSSCQLIFYPCLLVVLFVFFIDIILCCFLDWGVSIILRVCLFYEKELKVEWGMRGRRTWERGRI